MNLKTPQTCQDSAELHIQCPAGFVASGTRCGIKASGNDDLALILCPTGATAAAVFTRNIVCGAPIVVSRDHLKTSEGRVRGLLINSGCANAGTGDDGIRRTHRVLNALSLELDCPLSQVLMNSTGVIGAPLPDDKILAAVRPLIEACTASGLADAARAIMTTDTRIKMAQQEVHCQGRTCRVVGIAKGAGMIHPDMATMIAVVMTDADVPPHTLDRILRNSVEHSFHRISVDGDTSTNDSVFALASGHAGRIPEELVAGAVSLVTSDLAAQIVRDAEGASKLIHVRVKGAARQADALAVARTVACSLLVRTSVAGGDPNWGRILAAAGRSGVHFDINLVQLTINEIEFFASGQPVSVTSSAAAAAYARKDIVIQLDLGQGSFSDEFLTSDLTEQYVQINAEYTS